MREIDLGQVGDVDKVNTSLIELLLQNDFIPVITCLASDAEGNGYNINGDMFAGHIAGTLAVSQYIILTDVDGLLRDKDDPDTLIREVDISEIEQMITQNIIQHGMLPKMESSKIALSKGAELTRIINGIFPEQILEILGDKPVGTLIKNQIKHGQSNDTAIK
ncbi:MAG: acetylglutamate kinase, partial [candidate division Zixibacteria bacterium]|nr:acetylglutamate kinase [candidate division Zixibacteria bacterium]